MIGTQIEKYKLTRLIGEGGMASVYEGIHLTLETKVAIKVMKPELLVIDNIKARFLQEAKIMAGLDHPHIVRVIDYVEEGNTMAIVMEYLEGENLSEKIKCGGALSTEAAKGIFVPVLDAFIYAHGKGLVHRDVKPSNLFVCKNGSVKIMDFGIAKLIDGNSALTRTGAQMGTPTYMSPEQVEESKHIDQRSDIYSLGVTLFYMLDGAAPYDSTVSNFAIFTRIHNEPLPRLEGIDLGIRRVLEKATAKKVEGRFGNCEEFKTALLVGVRRSKVSPVSMNSEPTVLLKDTPTEGKVAQVAVYLTLIPPAVVEVAGGIFNMGSTNGSIDEKPVHEVRLNSFSISKYPITFDQYDAYCECVGIPKPNNGGWGRGISPVINVSWDDALAYCNWLSEQTGKNYRLPTEAEWEYASRGGNKSNNYKYSGSNDIGSVGWYWDNSGNKTHPVGEKQSNELGIYDMSGNVWEWCSDWYGDYSSASQDSPQGSTTGLNRVVRGGGWSDGAQYCRSAYRNNGTPSFAYYYIGFRVVLVP